jgi:hypothetical protein
MCIWLQGFTSVIEDYDPLHAKKVFELAVDMVGEWGVSWRLT